MIRAAVIVTVLSASLLAAGCQNSHPEKAEGSQDATSRIATQPAADPARAQRKGELSAAAEQFEMLTEEAFSADPARLASLLADAELSARSIEPQLPTAVADKLNMRIADASAAIAAQRPADTALAAVEAYRLVVTQFPASTKIPAAVSLLDYAGFRIQADLKSNPARWEDGQTALAFAKGQWADVSGKISDKALTAKFRAALDELGRALGARQLAKANQAAAYELDLVDELENFFEKA